MKTFLRIAIALVVVGALVAGAYMLVQRKRQLLARAPKYGVDPRAVTVAKSREGNLVEKNDYLAVVEPARTANMTPRVTAVVEEVTVDEGDSVKSGDVLIRLDSEEVKHRVGSVRAQIDQAEAELAANKATIRSLESSYDYWQAEFKRDRRLAEKDAIPQAQAEKTEERAAEVEGKLESARQKSTAINHRIESLKEQYEELQTKLGYYSITSPYDGVLAQRNVDPGDMASPSKPLVQVEDRGSLRLAFDVPQKDLPAVHEGLRVQFAATGRSRSSEITVMHPSLSKARMQRAEAWLQGDATKGLSPGSYIPVSVVIHERKGLTLVPRSSLIKSPEEERYVFRVEGGKLQAQKVEVVGFTNDSAGISGLEPDVDIVESTFLGWTRLSSGEKVKAVR